jgi:hypothetical protein
MKLRRNPIGRPGKKRPATFASLDPGPPLRSFTKESRENNKPSASHSGSQRVRLSRFFGASPVASALDLHPGRDPDAKELKLSCSARWEVGRSALLTHHRLAECQQAE